MKKILIIFSIILLGISPMFSQNINIPDANFLNALIGQGVDANDDGMISYTEAEAVTDLNVGGKGISDLTGIEAFINLITLECNDNLLTSLDVSNNTALTGLFCGYNQLTSLDVSNNTALNILYCYFNHLTSLDVSNNITLISLWCNSNQLTSLDVSNNTALTDLDCNNNQLTSLDVSNNTVLTNLYCYSNQLTSLDVSNNTALTGLDCKNNQLTSLDVSNNTALTYLQLVGMPTLYRVCVWEMPFPPVGVTLNITGSPNIYFTTECTVGIHSLKTEKEFIIYPNPSNGIINIDIDDPLDSYIEIHDIKGRMIYNKPAISNQIKIDISAYPKGVYFVKVKQQGVLKVGKVVW
jgi:hypothetical protein